jgi:hypothetical protein
VQLEIRTLCKVHVKLKYQVRFCEVFRGSRTVWLNRIIIVDHPMSPDEKHVACGVLVVPYVISRKLKCGCANSSSSES